MGIIQINNVSFKISTYLDISMEKIKVNMMALRSKLFRGFADETRVSILKMLSNGNKNVSEIVESLNLPQSTVSSHLSCLKDCNLVTSEKIGRTRQYSLASDLISEILQQIDQLLQICYSEIYHCVNYTEV